ncbi:ribose 5-phosphate isomerase A [Halobacillus shinanisalinarum]|uniref:Ribose 5-phosphate isomerase A n=1 Tax=Halobacillus shinanisalinarum TaxID=2932258 RepID=A0ABY4H520_9BACI|nr:ribose 5-phosphate isomerase A [Halobacillus shinanisalinarum]UOQ95219.1 ribose 5-phosphate isomerase A [Halobacillus shinanisalinarum]
MTWTNPLAKTLNWSGEISNQAQKEKVAQQVSYFVEDGDVIGVGSGSTSFLALQAISKRVKDEGLKIQAIPTSKEAALNCAVLDVPVTTLTAARPRWGFDGADEVDEQNRLIKGRGGALFAEKLVIASSSKTYILVDKSKFVKQLGTDFAVPVEVDPRAIHLVETKLGEYFNPQSLAIRMAVSKDGPIITEAGNFLVDVRFNEITSNMEREISGIPGVIDSGLFFDYPLEILSV